MIGRRVASVGEIEKPGDYCGPIKGYTGDLEACFFLKPNARDENAPPGARSIQHVLFPPHTYRECPDGSLEIRNSISSFISGAPRTPEFDDGWHGYLDEGHVWRQV
jgi:hypothetical protein